MSSEKDQTAERRKLTVNLDDEVWTALLRLTETLDRSQTWVVNQAVRVAAEASFPGGVYDPAGAERAGLR